MTDTVQRRPLPTRRHSWVQKIRIGAQPVYLCTGEYEDGTPGEIFLDVSRTGSLLKGFTQAFAITFSLALQHGVPLATLLDALRGLSFPPDGPVIGSPSVSEARSIVDFVVQELTAVYQSERPQQETAGPAVAVKQPSASSTAKEEGYAGETCSQCSSHRMKRNGSCLCCENCGSTSGCS